MSMSQSLSQKNVRPLFRLRFVNQLTKFEKTRMWDCEELSLHPSPHSSYLIIALIKVFKGGKRRFSEYLKKGRSLGWHRYQLSTKQRLVPVSSNPPRTKMPHVKWGCCLPCKIILPLNNESVPIYVSKISFFFFLTWKYFHTIQNSNLRRYFLHSLSCYTFWFIFSFITITFFVFFKG